MHDEGACTMHQPVQLDSGAPPRLVTVGDKHRRHARRCLAFCLPAITMARQVLTCAGGREMLNWLRCQFCVSDMSWSQLVLLLQRLLCRCQSLCLRQVSRGLAALG